MGACRIGFAFAIVLGIAATGCDRQQGASLPQEAAPSSGQTGTQEPAAGTPPAPGDDNLAAMVAGADVAKGKMLFLQCRACHSLVPEAEPGKIGPTLYGVIGRSAGTVPGYAYSGALAKSGITWTPEQISRWLARPSQFLPGNKMLFVGIEDPQDRADIIAFIREESAKPSP